MIIKLLRVVGIVVVFLLLTLITQVGGIIYLVSLLIGVYCKKKIKVGWVRRLIVPLIFIPFYLVCTGLIVPTIAKRFGRVPLPMYGELRPVNVMTCVLNRHYVRPALKAMVLDATDELRREFPDTKVNYFDANFPFLDGFPLWPHLSHSDGRKLDIGLFYRDKDGNVLDDSPSSVGYGVFEDPRGNEENYPAKCKEKGYWQYGWMVNIVPQDKKYDYVFDPVRLKKLMTLLVHDSRLDKILIEPHLKTRMKISSSKVRYHGCHAVRHDDHIHVQLK
jgi:hypothetical protein